jgi:hypothetical protein
VGSLSTRLRWAPFAAIHDWAVEALFDRLEVALRVGAVPERTPRPMPPVVAFTIPVATVALRLARRARRAIGRG